MDENKRRDEEEDPTPRRRPQTPGPSIKNRSTRERVLLFCHMLQRDYLLRRSMPLLI